MTLMNGSLLRIVMLGGFACSACFGFARALDPCRVDPGSQECLGSSGGTSAGGETGTDTGGTEAGGAQASGGSSAGGSTGGTSGSGGASGGQSGTGGSAGGRVVVSEIFVGGNGFVEIVNSGTAAISIFGYSIGASTVGSNIAPSLRCDFEEEVVLEPEEVAVAAASVAGCDTVDADVTCLSGCPFSLSVDATVYVFDAADSVADARQFGDDMGTPGTGMSWQAVPPASGDFEAALPTRGY